ncbi:MAG: hypothetical protein IKM61_05405 [Eubacteriaceae bacterium]|nr:hypothetical protein [Eubacteriaceae bacterium]
MKKMKRTISFLLAVMLFLGAFPGAVWADENDYIASVTTGDSGATEFYYDLVSAISEAAKYADCTVTILQDITLEEYVQITKGRFIIDLNGKSLTNEAGYVLWINRGVDITITDHPGGGKIERKDGPAAQGEAIHNEGTLTLDGGSVIAKSIGILSEKNVIINGGSIKADEIGIYVPDGLATINRGSVDGGKNAVWVGSAADHSSSLIVTGGTLSSDLYLRSDSDSSDSITLKGGTFKGGLNIQGSDLIGILADGAAYWQDGKMLSSVSGSVIDGDVTVKAGELEFADVELEYDKATYDGQKKTPEVKSVFLGGKELPAKNYSVSYGDNTDIGRATVIISPKGGSLISGQAEIAFAIMPDTTPIDGLAVENVTSDDEPAIMDVYGPMADVSTDGFKDDVKDEWDGIIDKCEELLDAIKAVQDKIKGFEDEVNKYDIDEVTENDYDDISALIPQIEDFALSPNLTDEEEQKLNDLADKARDLLKRIDDVRDKVEDIKDELGKYDEDTVTSDDKPAIAEIIDDIKDLLIGDNLTPAQRDEMQDALKKAEGLMGVIDDVAAKIKDVNDKIGNLEPENVTPEDEIPINEALATIDELLATDNLTDGERKDLEALKGKCGDLLDAVEAAKALELIKDAAKEELDGYKNPEDYRDEENDIIDGIVEDGKEDIDSAKTPEEVADALKDAKDELDKVPTAEEVAAKQLADAKEAAKKALEEYKDPEDYRDEEKQLLADAVKDGKGNIDAAGDIEGVNKALEDAKAEIDKIKTDAEYDAEEAAAELAKAKEVAKKELEEYKDPEDYRDEQKKELADAVDKGKGNIDGAKDLDGVKEAIENAKAEIDKIKTDDDLLSEEAAKYLLGDVDRNGVVNALDATQILRYANHKSCVLTDADAREFALLFKIADVDRNGAVNTVDATQILRYANNKPSSLDSQK